MRADPRAPVRRELPDRIELADIAPPNADRSELQIVPEVDEGRISTPTAMYRRERKQLSFQQRFAGCLIAAGVVVAHLLHVIG